MVRVLSTLATVAIAFTALFAGCVKSEQHAQPRVIDTRNDLEELFEESEPVLTSATATASSITMEVRRKKTCRAVDVQVIETEPGKTREKRTTRGIVPCGDVPLSKVAVSGKLASGKRLETGRKEIWQTDPFSCVTDESGRCTVSLTEELRVFVFDHPNITVFVDIDGTRLSGRLNSGDDPELAVQRSDHALATLADLIQQSEGLCSQKKPKPDDVYDRLIAIVREVREVEREFPDLAEKAKEKRALHWEKCSKWGPAIVKLGDRKHEKGEYYLARVTYFMATALLGENNPLLEELRAKQKKNEEVLATIKPERIGTLFVQSEGGGFVGYITLVTSKGEITVAPGTIALRVHVTDKNHPFDLCYAKAWSMSANEFEAATVGLGALARGTVLYRLPYVKWKDLECKYIRHQLETWGSLESLDWKTGFRADIQFKTAEGEVLEASESFRP